jgi:hypothetical protein
MEVLRVPPYPITTTWDVPDANHTYLVSVEDVVDHSVETLSVTSTSGSKINYILPRSKVQFDREFVFRVYDTDINGEIVIDDNLSIYRPYVDFTKMGLTGPEQADYKKWEIIARSIMDSYLGNDSATGEGFYNHKLIVQGVGEGNDYFPMWHNPKKILKVYENNQLVYNGEDTNITLTTSSLVSATGNIVTLSIPTHNYTVGDVVTISGIAPISYNGTYQILSTTSTTISFYSTATGSFTVGGIILRVWDRNYVIAPNNSAIMRVESNMYNRYEQTPLALPIAYGDVGPYGLTTGSIAFPKGFDYIFVLDVGYKAIPPDVEQAAMMLIDDLQCNRNDYYKRFVTQYDTDQFSIKYSAAFLGGTGNNIVDKILDGYKGDVIKPGIL